MIQTEALLPVDTSAVTDSIAVPSAEKIIDTLGSLSLEDTLNKFANSLVDFAFKLVIAILVFYLGKFIINKLYKVVRRVMEARNTDASLRSFVLSLLRIALYFILIITVIGILGIETSSFIALFASAGVAIGMALSGTLQNFAGGVLILLLKPYRVGDFIEVQGYSGTVKAIQIFHTIINTIDNKAIIIPNGGLSTGSINNYSLEHFRRVEWTLSLSYSTDLEQAKQTILEMLNSDVRVLQSFTAEDHPASLDSQPDAETAAATKQGFWKRLWHHQHKHVEKIQKAVSTTPIIELSAPPIDCAPFVALNQMADSGINILVRAWTRSSDYWPLYFAMNERFYTELPRRGFSFPYPQLDVHMA